MNLIVSSTSDSIVSRVALNPQPLPPAGVTRGTTSLNLWPAAINQQLSPPKASQPEFSSSLWGNTASAQPTASPLDITSYKGMTVIGGRQLTSDEFCGTHPRPIPPRFGTSLGAE